MTEASVNETTYQIYDDFTNSTESNEITTTENFFETTTNKDFLTDNQFSESIANITTEMIKTSTHKIAYDGTNTEEISTTIITENFSETTTNEDFITDNRISETIASITETVKTTTQKITYEGINEEETSTTIITGVLLAFLVISILVFIAYVLIRKDETTILGKLATTKGLCYT